MRVLFFLALLMTVLIARENPFAPGARESVNAPSQEAPETVDSVEEDESVEMKGEPTAVSESENYDFGVIKFFVSGGVIQVETKDKLKEHLAVKNPTRFVLNFLSDSEFPTRRQILKLAPYHEIRVGSHKGYYSVVIELDSPARYKITPFDNGYTLVLY